MCSRCPEGHEGSGVRGPGSGRPRLGVPARHRSALLLGIALVGCLTTAGAGAQADARAPRSPTPDPRPLRVCADPNNLPFSDEKRRGFENALAELVARELGTRVEYTWWAQRRGFFRNTLNAGLCDVVMGVPAGFELAATTRPYYRSGYVFLTRRDGPRLRSLDDPALRSARVAVQLVGDDGANTPPAHALARRGIVRNVTGYSVLGDYRRQAPPARIVEAVAAGEVDVAIVWGPLAGYFARRQRVPLRLTPVTPQRDGPLPLAFDIAMGVRRDDDALRRRLDAIIVRRRAAIDSLLAKYGVPRVPGGAGDTEERR